ncbi:alpha/beta-hydrolase [Macrolepiota fuliginosa MF-IS2]|uniref:Alpha/beta-hydrolase n=1 Tax=Macrolepiota fuliginosa MF-IS2 TaxID=1400762 RepID=A0A9P5XTB2_9AGAR|nr:alpha/beta-hydrolase [Macrolepiota fuliginosa MF-IS2]
MDVGSYKTLVTSRGLVYRYFCHRPSLDTLDRALGQEESPLPTLLFVHGFPTNSRVWQNQVAFFAGKGFPVLAPDLLAFGGSAKPLDPEVYVMSLVCQDLLDILDYEGVKENVVAVGHDMGSKVVSRLANFHEDRFLGFAFLAVPYVPPRPNSNMELTAQATKKMCGYELNGHFMFFSEEDAAETVQRHLESFYTLMFPEDPKIWVTDLAPVGALRARLEANKIGPYASYMRGEYEREWLEEFGQENAFPAPLCYFKGLVSGLHSEDDRVIPLEKYNITKPVFLGSPTHDYISRSQISIVTVRHHCPNATIREFNDGRWFIISSARQINHALHSWVMDLV